MVWWLEDGTGDGEGAWVDVEGGFSEDGRSGHRRVSTVENNDEGEGR